MTFDPPERQGAIHRWLVLVSGTCWSIPYSRRRRLEWRTPFQWPCPTFYGYIPCTRWTWIAPVLSLCGHCTGTKLTNVTNSQVCKHDVNGKVHLKHETCLDHSINTNKKKHIWHNGEIHSYFDVYSTICTQQRITRSPSIITDDRQQFCFNTKIDVNKLVHKINNCFTSLLWKYTEPWVTECSILHKELQSKL